jgi:tetratricopeptide (TPR) repeat protein
MILADGGLIHGIATIVLAVLIAGFVVVYSIMKAEDPSEMAIKWLATAGVIFIMVWKVAPMVGAGGYGAAFGGIPFTAVCGFVLAFIWRRTIAGWVANPVASLYDGGNEPPIPRPAYSVAQARQKQGKYYEAVLEIRRQLDRFPTDFEGHIFLAEVQAEDLKDLNAAELTIQQLCAQPGHAQINLVFALYSMADWHLKYGQDREAARRNLQQVIDTFPDSEYALVAAQRIARLSTMESLLAPHERKRFAVAEGIKNLGLVAKHEPVAPIELGPIAQTAEYVKHLEEHPLDTEARERLAVLYADHYGRLDLALDQLEQMIQQPNQPARLINHWLNLLADLQVRGGCDYETVRATLQRIIDRNADLAPAHLARNRLALLKLELKSQQKTESVRMGAYDQNIGLKNQLPRPHER